MYNPHDSLIIAYDDTLSVKLKTRYAIDSNLGGIMFWQVNRDGQEQNSLVSASMMEIIGPEKPAYIYK